MKFEEIGILNKKFEGEAPQDILRYIISQGGPYLSCISSFGAESAVLLHMISQIDKDIPVIFIDTRKHFSETYLYKNRLIDQFGFTQLITTFPSQIQQETLDLSGELHKSDPDGCCHFRKTLPMLQALRNFKYYITGRKKFQSEGRKELNVFEKRNTWININPLASYSKEDLEIYFLRHDIPRHPLEEDGYPSIGCECCTNKCDNYREGRWAGSKKTECGIHVKTEI